MYSYQKLLGFAMLKGYLKPKVPSDADSHVMTWVQTSENGATDIYWKTEIKMG
jgi:hypothetical protein